MISKKIICFIGVLVWLSSCQKTPVKEYNTEYYKNGQKKQEGYLINGKPTGQWKFYWKNGHLRTTKNYTRQTKLRSIATGKSFVYHYENGRLRYENFLNQEGNLEGVSKGYFKDGKTLRAIYHYKNGQSHGVTKIWDKQGKLLVHDIYEEGVLIKSIIKKGKSPSSISSERLLDDSGC
ncbi:MAG TPA: hypothetical protein DCS93_28625 [Microscillaceae bacterium]|nr:hypothetical protein [Microscillaceae bacterium]